MPGKGNTARRFRISDEEYEAAQAVAAERGETISDICRAALAAYVKRYGTPTADGPRDDVNTWLARFREASERFDVAELAHHDLTSDAPKTTAEAERLIGEKARLEALMAAAATNAFAYAGQLDYHMSSGGNPPSAWVGSVADDNDEEA